MSDIDLTDKVREAINLAVPDDLYGWRDRYTEKAVSNVMALVGDIARQARERVAQAIEARAEQVIMAAGWECDHIFAGATCQVCFDNASHAVKVAARIARADA